MGTSAGADRAGARGRRLERCVWLLGCAAVVAAAAPPAAVAADVAVPSLGPSVFAQPVLRFDAHDGEVNVVSIAADADAFVVEDRGAALVAGEGCVAVDANRARCDRAATFMSLSLGDGDDRLEIADSVYPALAFQFSYTVGANGGAGDDELRGGVGNDRFVGEVGDDLLLGGGGDDELVSVFGFGEGVDSSAPDGDDVIDGGPGADRVEGGPGRDELRGGEGGDRLDGGSGPDRLDGGAGADVADGGHGPDSIEGGEGDDTVVGGNGDDLVSGGPGADQLEGFGPFADESEAVDDRVAPGRDVLDGGDGDDRLLAASEGLFEPDRFVGGAGVDSVSYGGRRSPVRADADGIADDGAPGEGGNVGTDVERLIGGSDSDTLVGGDGPNLLDGGRGDDLLDGRGGDDTLEGGVADSGSDGLVGGAGRDTLRGGPGEDALDGGADPDDLAGGGGSDSLDGGDGADALAGGPGIDRLAGGPGDDVLRGGDAVLVGADAADALAGGAGADTLLAGPGNDTLDGGAGADRLSGESGRDTVTYDARGAEVSVSFDGLANDGEAGEGDRVDSDVEAVLGGAVQDTLTGDQRANGLDGGSGEDYLDGAGGRDALSGGSARDTLRSRDGTPDVVACGPDVDFAIADRLDTVRDCERVDRGGPRPRLPARGAEVDPQEGTVGLRVAGASRFVNLRDDVVVPSGSALDTRRGRLRLAAAGRHGARQAATFYDGLFVVRRHRRAGGLTDLVLRGGDFDACPAAGAPAAARAAAARTVRRLWGRGGRRRARFRTRGRWSTATVRGTVWLVEDRCDGTLTRAVAGEVVVHDLVRDVRVVLGPGESYLARAGGRR